MPQYNAAVPQMDGRYPSIHGECREPELFFSRSPMQIPGKGDLEMEQRDWELLDKQMRGLSPPRNDAIIVFTVVAMFFAGMTLGGLLFPRQGEPLQIASWAATACDHPSEWCTTNQTATAGVRQVSPGDSRHIIVR